MPVMSQHRHGAVRAHLSQPDGDMGTHIHTCYVLVSRDHAGTPICMLLYPLPYVGMAYLFVGMLYPSVTTLWHRTLALPQRCHLRVQAHLFIHRPCLSIATWCPGRACSPARGSTVPPTLCWHAHACLKAPACTSTVSQHLHVAVQKHLFAHLPRPVLPFGTVGMPAHPLALSKCHHMAAQACLLLCLPGEHLFARLPCSSTPCGGTD